MSKIEYFFCIIVLTILLMETKTMSITWNISPWVFFTILGGTLIYLYYGYKQEIKNNDRPQKTRKN